ncbi:MAG: 23S rRNA (adenine(2503)-C(2))-methyltransferase RlmN [Leptospiraceae bacterium]|nr:23S rRNA (adenine(2503)-C(2))-methyltransferase RlmN [Leptospiraceae bacterium]
MTLNGASINELERLFQDLGEAKFRALQAFRWINRHQADNFDEFSDFSKSLRERLKELPLLPKLKILGSEKDKDGTEKYLFEVPPLSERAQPRQIEAVWIVADNRRTICISSQIGCTLNCTFCATGTLPFYGNLPAWAIVDQVYAIMRHRSERPTNIVFMGMGEPFHNYQNVIKAARILHHPEGMHLGASHITISTAGVIPSIEKYIHDKEPFNLAISLNHPDPAGRLAIMDVTKKHPLDKLLKTLRQYTRERDRKITFEYVMIPDQNMDRDAVQKLIKLARSVRCKINLIPLNTTLGGMRRPSMQEADEFYQALLDAGLTVFNRGSPGRNVNAACGMLALQAGGH